MRKNFFNSFLCADKARSAVQVVEMSSAVPNLYQPTRLILYHVIRQLLMRSSQGSLSEDRFCQ